MSGLKNSMGLLFFLISAAAWAVAAHTGAAVVPKISLEEVLSIGSLDDDLLFQWVGVAADELGFIYVSDSLDFSLKKFDARGKLVRKAGRKGQGPGEFLAPRLLGCSPEFLFVTDQNIPGIQVFDKDLQFQRRIPFTTPIVDMCVLGNDRLAVKALFLEKSAGVYILDGKGEVRNELRLAGEDTGLLMDMASLDFDSGGNLYVAFTFEDRVEKYGPDGKKLWTIKLLEGRRANKAKISSYVVPTEVVLKDIVLDRRGNVFVLGGHFSRNASRDVYVLSPQGEHRTTFTLPEPSHCLYIDSRNFLYSRANEGVTLKKYRLSYE